MDLNFIVATARDRYVRQFREFAMNQRSKCDRGAAEVKMVISETAGLFKSLCCADFVVNDDQVRVVELAPDHDFSFDPIRVEYGTASLFVRHLQWDDVVLRHDLDELPQAQLEHWFEPWFDLDDQRYEEGAELSNIIHSLLIKPRWLSIDFGTAEPTALWDLFDLIKNSGATPSVAPVSRPQ